MTPATPPVGAAPRPRQRASDPRNAPVAGKARSHQAFSRTRSQQVRAGSDHAQPLALATTPVGAAPRPRQRASDPRNAPVAGKARSHQACPRTRSQQVRAGSDHAQPLVLATTPVGAAPRPRQRASDPRNAHVAGKARSHLARSRTRSQQAQAGSERAQPLALATTPVGAAPRPRPRFSKLRAFNPVRNACVKSRPVRDTTLAGLSAPHTPSYPI
jgi:hypothetical protein